MEHKKEISKVGWVAFLKVWIDITNAPHVRFFKDIINYLESNGNDLIVTARDYGDIHNLMDDFGIDFISVGRHGGMNLYEKLKESANRVNKLVDIIAFENVDVSLAKHSSELPRVSFGLGIPNIYAIDNEYAEAVNKMTLPLCDKIIAPNVINTTDLIKYGVNPDKLIRYEGTSELMHIKSFKYNENIFEDLNLNFSMDKTILMRPEPSFASYLDLDSETSLLSPIIETLNDHANILVLPRFKEQSAIFDGIKNVNILKSPVDIPSIIKKCALIIGAGGTMNREAALLNTPVISCYPGKTLAVDQYYIDKGLMFKSNKTDEIVNKALSFLIKDNKDSFKNNNHERLRENLFKTIINNF